MAAEQGAGPTPLTVERPAISVERTIDRGSNASATVLAAALGVPECGIFTDVPGVRHHPGVFTADPRVVPHARRLESLPRHAVAPHGPLATLTALVSSAPAAPR